VLATGAVRKLDQDRDGDGVVETEEVWERYTSMFIGKSKNVDGSIKEFEKMRNALKRAEHSLSWDASTTGAARSEQKGDETVIQSSATSTATTSGTSAIPAPTDPGSSVVSKGTIWQGTLKVEGSVRIDGQLSGEVEARQLVYVSEGAEVDAQIRAAMVTIGGRFQGKVQCTERLEILPTGKVNADLTTKSLVIHEGAFLEGQIHMTEREVPGATPPLRGKALDQTLEVLKSSSLGVAAGGSSASSSPSSSSSSSSTSRT
jgi:cytoskeletal protein CcmA (bactofilin family)